MEAGNTNTDTAAGYPLKWSKIRFRSSGHTVKLGGLSKPDIRGGTHEQARYGGTTQEDQCM